MCVDARNSSLALITGDSGIMNTAARDDVDGVDWEQVKGTKPRLLRLNVPGGWLVTVSGGASYPVTFYPDLEHAWNPPIKN